MTAAVGRRELGGAPVATTAGSSAASPAGIPASIENRRRCSWLSSSSSSSDHVGSSPVLLTSSMDAVETRGTYMSRRLFLCSMILAYAGCGTRLAVAAPGQGGGGNTGSTATDRAALLVFAAGVTSDPQNALVGWSNASGAPHCDWAGVRCHRPTGRVAELDLSDRSLAGTISPALGALSLLAVLDLSRNSFTGRIPPELGRLSGMTQLSLSFNALQGPIPQELGALTRLVYLNLGSNRLDGGIPAALLCNSSELQYADLTNNSLGGRLHLGHACKLDNLRFLLIWSNELVGQIPPALSNASMLRWFDAEMNYLSGELPSDLVEKTPLLQILYLSYNNFSSHGANSNLEPFFLSLSNCRHLQEVELAGNNLGGALPPAAIGNLSASLVMLHLEENQISGPVPPNISNLLNLTYLNLSNNILNGSIPPDLGHLRKLERLYLSNNKLAGEIPSALGDIPHLGLLDLSYNLLTGPIPEKLSNLSQLRTLLLNNNHLSESIPSTLGSCVNLETLDLSHNRLTGSIPGTVAGLGLKLYLNLSSNALEGRIPLELSKMEMVLCLDLSSNRLSGTIPPQLGSCVALEYLNLSGNHLGGAVPNTIGALPYLEVLDLAANELVGTLPQSLQASSSLRKLNVSFNGFAGSLPAEGVFALLSADSFLGNPGLCGSLPAMPACTPKRARRRSSSVLLYILLAVVVGASGIVAITTYLLMRRSKIGRLLPLPVFRRAASPAKELREEKAKDYPRISHRQLVVATDGFESSNLIGSGRFGHVYRGSLGDGVQIAVKVFDPRDGAGEMAGNFRRECQVLKRTRHRNLIRIITACSKPDFKALVLPLMPNGSLESHLYPPRSAAGGRNQLSLRQVVSICGDVAEGMAYLHHYSAVKVIHCDLKPSNVLLDEDFTAFVSDFGISRLVKAMDVCNNNNGPVDSSSCSSLTGLLCGSVGYIAPEYGLGGQPSTQGDVYSFGVLLLEVVAGKRPTDVLFQEGQTLQDWVKSHHPDNLAPIVEAALSRDGGAAGGASEDCRRRRGGAVVQLLELGLACTQHSPTLRPTMVDVAREFSRLKEDLRRLRAGAD